MDTNPDKCEKGIINYSPHHTKEKRRPFVLTYMHSGKAFGVTDFINPNDSNEPIQQVIVNEPILMKYI